MEWMLATRRVSAAVAMRDRESVYLRCKAEYQINGSGRWKRVYAARWHELVCWYTIENLQQDWSEILVGIKGLIIQGESVVGLSQ